MQKYTEQATVKKVQKFYSTLSNAYSLARKENGTVSEWGLTGADTQSAEKIYEILFKPYFKIAKDCGGNNTGGCISMKSYILLYQTNANRTNGGYSTATNYYKIALNDGASIFWRGSGSSLIYVFYDVNGPKEPNQWGKDLFEFSVINNGAIPSGMQTGKYAIEPFNSYCADKSTASGYGCAAWVIYKGNMDYLHCDLTWDKNSCKDK